MEINYQTLHEFAAATSYTDHIFHFRKLFASFEVNTFLEWGCGYSSKIFLENSKKVISVELVLDESEVSSKWMNHCIEKFGEQPTWVPILKVCSDSVKAACRYQSFKHKDYALIDNTYVTDLDQYIKTLISENDITVSFVDAGVYIRGDLTELSLQNRIPIVIAHDTANSFPDYPLIVERQVNEGLYGWFKVKRHDEYQKIFINHGCGTTFWIRKDFPELVDAMMKYSDEFENSKITADWTDSQSF